MLKLAFFTITQVQRHGLRSTCVTLVANTIAHAAASYQPLPDPKPHLMSTFSLPQNHQQQQQHTTPGKINSNLHSLTLAFPSFKNFLYSSLKTMNRKLLKIYSYLKLLILCLMSHKCYLGHWHSWATEYNCGISWLYSFLIYVLYHFLP